MLSVSGILIQLVGETLCWSRLAFRSRQSIENENLFLRRQLALYVERGVKPRRVDPATRITLALVSRFFNWRDALVVVRPETMIRWHRADWKLFWRLRSQPGRPPIPKQIQALIRRMGRENPSWGEERIANELLLKFGIQVSPRTVRKYLPPRPPGRPRGSEQLQMLLAQHGVICSMSRSGDCWSVNAAMESFFSTLKTERCSRKVYRLSPLEFEQQRRSG